ncbi:MAG TPA: flagellin [Bryobacteraceae bacterium]|jgi:flagellin|nr:flagellin [Bryobacteraceae bacterium]
MISIQTNVDSLVAQSNMNVNQAAQSKTIQQLTSGYRINSSADDAAGLAIANTYRDNIAQLNQGVRNANDGISQLQIVDGGLSNISNILDRMQTLATQSASDTFTGSRTVLDNEYQGLLKEIDRQASNINLSGALGGSATFNSKLSIYVGGGSSAANAAVTVDLSGATNLVDSSSLGLGGTSITTGNANAAIAAITTAISNLGNVQGVVGAGENKLNYAVGLANSQIANFSAAQSQIRDADVAADAANLSKGQVLMQTSVAAMAQANQESQSVLKLLQG